eukprot:2083817-Rhodomonas_salina.1
MMIVEKSAACELFEGAEGLFAARLAAMLLFSAAVSGAFIYASSAASCASDASVYGGETLTVECGRAQRACASSSTRSCTSSSAYPTAASRTSRAKP